MAKDFHTAFELQGDTAGEQTEDSIATVDADGVLFGAVQALSTQLDELRSELAETHETRKNRDTRLDDVVVENRRKDSRIEELEEDTERQKEQIAELETELDELREDNQALRERLATIEEHLNSTVES